MDILCDIHNNPKYMTDFYTSTNDNIKKLLNNMHHKKKIILDFYKKTYIPFPTLHDYREKKKCKNTLFRLSPHTTCKNRLLCALMM